MPGPDKMRPDEADELIAQLLEKYDTNNDKKFSYGGSQTLQIQFLTLLLVFLEHDLNVMSSRNINTESFEFEFIDVKIILSLKCIFLVRHLGKFIL
jgi:hypothetical protein